jgi:hypothetical protein
VSFLRPGRSIYDAFGLQDMTTDGEYQLFDYLQNPKGPSESSPRSVRK